MKNFYKRLPKLISSLNRLACIECNSRKAHVLVFGEHTDREQIGFAKMIHKPTNITIKLGINAVDLSNLFTI